jgi:ADP-ribose pyrophosphatase
MAHGTFRRSATAGGGKAHPAYPPCSGFTFRRFTLKDHGYKPVEFTHPVVFENDRTVKTVGGWADPADPLSITSEIAARHSFTGPLQLNSHGRPINPTGRTGYTGRGLLGKWGPNKAADAIVSRRRKDGRLEIVVIERKDTKQWALPGGMVDDGEAVAIACKREFIEEAGNVPEDKRVALLEQIDELFRAENAQVVYQGYVEDPRNTDNAWMESSFFHFPCPSKLAKGLFLNAGDDASDVKWLLADEEEPEFVAMYADHRKRVMQAVVQAFRGAIE